MVFAEQCANERVSADIWSFMRLKHGIADDVEHVVNHPGQHLPQQFVALLKARIGVDFDNEIVQRFV